MGSNPTGHGSNQVVYTCHGYYIRRECSKAQMCLQKILHIISSNPRQESSVDSQIGKLELDGNIGGNGGFRSDFNLRLGLSMPEEEQKSLVLVEDGGGGNDSVDGVPVGGSSTEKSSEGECEVENVKCPESPPETESNEDEEDYEVATEKNLAASEIAKFHVERGDAESKESDENESKRTAEEESKEEKLRASTGGGSDDGGIKTVSYRQVKYKSGGDCLGLLIEAARLILGDIGETESEAESTHEYNEFSNELEELSQPEKVLSESNSSGSKRKLEGNWMLMNLVRGIEDRSPVVRTKRGRSQVLPCRYRDSVLEPWRSPPLSSKVSRRQRRSRCGT